jgi:proton-coupled amino acid transporter
VRITCLFRSTDYVVTESCFIPVAVAIAVPDLGPIISLVGALCFSTLGLFVPAVIETVTYWEHGLGWRLWKNIFVILFALLALITGSYASVLEIIREYTEDE